MKHHHTDAEVRLSYDEAMEVVVQAVEQIKANNAELADLVERLRDQ